MEISGASLQRAEHPIPNGRRPVSASNGNGAGDNQSIYSSISKTTGNPYSHGPYANPGKAHSIHLIASSNDQGGQSLKAPKSDAASTTSKGTKKSGYAKSVTGTVQTDFSMHSKAFEDFQNSRGVKTFIGSIGPIDNVRMMVSSLI